MLNSWFRVISALLIMFACYTAYAIMIVPWIEPSEKPDIVDPTTRPPTPDKMKMLLANWFEPGDWELDLPKVFETKQGMLIFDDYQPRENGYVELRPCSMVFLSNEPNISEEDRIRRAVILQAPEGALLRFDPPLEFSSGKSGRFVGGELLGEVDIRSGQRLPGPEDDLHVKTRDVVMTETDVMTPHQLSFSLGGHHGSGLGVHIRLDSTTGGEGVDVRGVQAFTLERQVFFHLQPTGQGDIFPGADDKNKPTNAAAAGPPGIAAAPPSKAAPSPPVEIHSSGPFTFDFTANTALFRKDVDVQRLHPDGTCDTMTGDQLKVYFASRVPPPGSAAADKPAGDGKSVSMAGKQLDPTRVELVGEPVTIRAPANDLQARAQFVEHDLPTRETHLRDAIEVIVRTSDRELRAPELFIQPAESGSYGTFRAVGRGRFDGRSLDDPKQLLHAEWTSHVHFRPYEDRHVLSVYGGAKVESAEKGSLTGDEIHLWLKEVPKAAQVAAAPEQKPQTELAPDRLLALGNVDIRSPQLVGKVQRMEAWFEHEPPPGGLVRKVGFRGEQLAQAPVQFAPAVFPEAAAPGAIVPLPVNGPPPVQQFHIDGEILRLQVAVVEKEMQVREVVVEKNVQLIETQTKKPDDKPLKITGDLLHVVQPNKQESYVTIVGAPAYVEAQEMTVTGGKMTLHRPTPDVNRTAVEGQGVLTMPVERDLQGNATAVPETLHLTWQGGMTFDGTVAEFDRGVEGRMTSQFLRTDRLKVTFDGPVNGAEKRGDQKPQIAHVDCYEGVFIESRTLAPDGNMTAVDRILARTLSLDQKSGDFTADGPGEVTSIRLGTAGKPTMPGGTEPAANVPPAQPAAAAAPAKTTINFLHVKFARNVVGNNQRREMTFHNQVQTVYGPVPDWSSRIDSDRPESWLPQTVAINCDRMQVMARPDPNTKADSYDLVAEGNTLAEGTNFTARAPRLTYAQAKDLLVIEGDGRTDAVLYHQDHEGGPRSDTSARRFMVWPSTNRVQIDGATFLELTPK